MVKKQGIPRQGELVFCTVNRMGQFAAWCTVDEYENLEGMIHISEAAGKWVHDIKKFIKPNKQYVTKVVKIDPATNTINLSLKRVSKSEEKSKWNEYRRMQRGDNMLKIIAKDIKSTPEQAYKDFGFVLQEEYGDLYIAFEEIDKSPSLLEKLKVPQKWHEPILKVLEKNFIEKEFDLRAELSMSSYESDGIERIRKFLQNLEKTGISVSYISAPKYRLEMKTKNPKLDTKKFERELQKIKEDAVKSSVMVEYSMIQ